MTDEIQWDCFISYAAEDRDGVVEPLARELTKQDTRVWYDQWVLRIGDSLRRTIDRGLLRSRFGVVILSPNFFRKEWPQRELDGLVQREVSGQRVILPVWHNVTHADVAKYSLPLADRVAGSTSSGTSKLAEQLITAMKGRRNGTCGLVESRFLQAQTITGRVHKTTPKEEIDISKVEIDYEPSREAEQVLSLARGSGRPRESIPLKLQLLNKEDQACVINNLVGDIQNRNSVSPLMSIISSDSFKSSSLDILEQTLRQITISNNLQLKKDFMETVPISLLKSSDEGLRKVFFIEIIGIINFDQFKHVNIIVPGVANVQDAIPETLQKQYLKAMLEMAKSSAYKGKPASQKALLTLPDKFVEVALEIFNDREFLFLHRDGFYKEFLRHNQRFLCGEKGEMMTDFSTMSEKDFFDKWPIE